MKNSRGKSNYKLDWKLIAYLVFGILAFIAVFTLPVEYVTIPGEEGVGIKFSFAQWVLFAVSVACSYYPSNKFMRVLES